MRRAPGMRRKNFMIHHASPVVCRMFKAQAARRGITHRDYFAILVRARRRKPRAQREIVPNSEK
jgi:hypothetical protein